MAMNAETQQDVIRKRVANYEVFTPYEPAPSGNSPTITLREEQEKAVAAAGKYFEKGLAEFDPKNPEKPVNVVNPERK